MESTIGELRGVFGVHLAQLAAAFGLDIEDDLASILPVSDDGEDGRSHHRSRRAR